jgi:enoyl-CoA hydratase/carnithine racemase
VSDLILCDEHEHVATLTLNRPAKRNAMSPDLLTDLSAQLRRLRENPGVRVLILRGQGTEAFSAGYDIGHLPARKGNEPLPDSDGVGLFQRMLEQVRTFHAPVIAMIHGFCMGGGLELAATCDIRLTADTGTFCMPPARLGTLYSGEGLLRFVNLIGIANTCEIFYTACRFDARRAHHMGLLNHVIPAAELELRTGDMAQQIVRNAPLAVKNTKTSLAHVLQFQDFSQHAETLKRLRDACMQSDDFQEGRRAFLEKRPPMFRGG